MRGEGGVLEKAMPEKSPERPTWGSSEGGVGKGTLCGQVTTRAATAYTGKGCVWRAGGVRKTPAKSDHQGCHHISLNREMLLKGF